MNTKHKGKRGFVALKLYVSKAYDRVELGFFGECYFLYRFFTKLNKFDFEVWELGYVLVQIFLFFRFVGLFC